MEAKTRTGCSVKDLTGGRGERREKADERSENTCSVQEFFLCALCVLLFNILLGIKLTPGYCAGPWLEAHWTLGVTPATTPVPDWCGIHENEMIDTPTTLPRA